MRKIVATVACVVTLAGIGVPVALADGNVPNGGSNATTGYEGIPGNQAH